MPAPIDLTGRQFGKLTVIRQVSPPTRKMYGGAWLCRCECGREEIIRATRLPYTPSNKKRSDAAWMCSTCRHTRKCAICQKTFVSRRAKYCSPECRAEHERRRGREHYRKRLAEMPFYNKIIVEQRKARAEADPEYAQRLRESVIRQSRKAYHKIKSDPEAYARYLELCRQRGKRYEAKRRLLALAQVMGELENRMQNYE